ncbi:MAG: hypothetical protein Q7K98_05425 [Candidatus Omnitrophota bacterium]|nr:hypothetical protein [Candidatus Omnitrophota bacterium]
MFKTLNKREKNILLLTSAVIIFGLSLRTIIAPLLTKNEALNKEIKLTQLKLKKYLRLVNQKESLQGAYAKISANANIPIEGEDVSTSILSQIENLAKNSNLNIIDIRPESQKNLSSSKESYVELRTEGDMESCLKFIYNIENSLALLEVKKSQLRAKPGSSNLEGNFLISQVSL